MTRTKKPLSRCLACHMRLELCICPQIRAFRDSQKIRTRVEILMHHRERHLTTNTARLAALMLNDCRIHYRGLPQKPLDCSKFLSQETQALLLYPSEDAKILNTDFLKTIHKPVTLIVPDGSWRQAYKVSTREDALKSIPRVTLEPGRLSQYKLRREPKENGLATFEAIARALGVIEGEHVQESMEEVFLLMVKRTLKSRGYVNPASRA